MSETDLVRCILKELARLKVWAWRVNAGVFGPRRVRGAPEGTPDILGILPGGVLFGLEAKTERGKLSASQLSWHETARFHGVRVEVVRSVTHAVTSVTRWRDEALQVLKITGEDSF